MVRNSVVAGQFYSGSESLLRKEIGALVSSGKKSIDALGAISPHAGYMYSGAVAGEVLAAIKPADSYIILGPNHTGFGKPFGVDPDRDWRTPLGEVPVDRELAGAILESSKYIKKDTACHDREHSIEVQLPLLQYINKKFVFVPIAISYSEKKVYKEIGTELAAVIKDSKKKVTIIASSDMTHYEPQESASEKDGLAIERILKLDVDGFLDTVRKRDISMCGFAPAAIMLYACLELGARNARLIKYATSGAASGDYSAVVGYAGIAVY